MKRRQFLKQCGASVAYLSCSNSLLTACQSNNIRYSSALHEQADKLTVSMAELGTKDFIYVRHPTEPFPICIVKTDKQQYMASLMKCTHQHCTVERTPSLFICPCHGAKFTHEGILLKGPAEKNLIRYNVILEDEMLVISLS